MRIKKYHMILGFLCLLGAGLSGCQKVSSETTASNSESLATQEEMPMAQEDFFAMDTYMTIRAYGQEAESAVAAAKEAVLDLDQRWSTGNPDSEISQLNQEKQANVSADTGALLSRALELSQETEGIFDITIYPLMEAWGFTSQNYRIPEEEEIENLLTHVDYGQISLGQEADGEVPVTLVDPQVKVDLGGIAKGYTSWKIMEIFQEYGVEHGLVSLGGNVQVLGHKPQGQDWKVAVENPAGGDDYLGILSVSDTAVITSGGYERYFEADGKTWHHIIDPATGYPARSGLTSVTIISQDGTLADGLSTTLFILGAQEAEEYWRNHAEAFDMILVDDLGNVSATPGAAERFVSENPVTVIEP